MRTPKWLTEGGSAFLYPLSLVCAATAVLYVINLWVPVAGVQKSDQPLWIVVPWVAMLGLGGLLVLIGRPLYALRVEITGEALLVGALFIFTAVALAAGVAHLLSAGLFASLAYGTWVQMSVNWTALRGPRPRRRGLR